MPKAVLFALLLSLDACSTVPSVTAKSADADGVTYEFPTDQQEEARHQAMLYCANLGRRAALKSTIPEESGQAIAAFDCR
jgi:hypothetical protein